MNEQVTAQNQIAARQRVGQNIEGHEFHPVGRVECAISLNETGYNISANVVKRLPVNFLCPIKVTAWNIENDLRV